MSQGDNELVLKAVDTNLLNEKENMNGDHDEKYTVIRVKRKTTDDPERALTINSKKRKLDDIFQYAGSLPLDSSEAKLKEITLNVSRKRKIDPEPVGAKEALIKETLSAFGVKKAKDEAKSLIYDITHEEIKNKKQTDDIVQNGTKLIREQLVISDKPNELNDYVYDIYYAPRDIDFDEEMIIEGYEYHDRNLENEDRPDWEEDEDSNDEDNWKNDYPDEDSDDIDSEESYERYGYDRDDYEYRGSNSDDDEARFDHYDDFNRDDDDY